MSCEVVAAAEGRVARLAGLGIDLLASARYSVPLKNASEPLPPLPTQLTLSEWQASNPDPFKDLGTYYQHIESFSKGTMNLKIRHVVHLPVDSHLICFIHPVSAPFR